MKTSKYKLKVITGFRKDQEHTIDANEAHKAYYLFNNKEKRGTFDDGLALEGRDIQKIVPDYNATMGYNPTYILTNDDWNDIKNEGVDTKLKKIAVAAKGVAKLAEPEELAAPLSKLLKGKYVEIVERTGSKFAQEVLTLDKK